MYRRADVLAIDIFYSSLFTTNRVQFSLSRAKLLKTLHCIKAMSLNSSRLQDSWCSFLPVYNASKSTSVYFQVTVTSCVVASLLAPMAVVGNALIMAAIWRNPSLRTPSYVLLAGLAFTDFCTGLLSQPFYVMYRLADLTGDVKMCCIAGVVTESVALYFSSLTFVVLTMVAVERWLHMSRRPFLTVRRVVILYITFAVFLVFSVGARIYWDGRREILNVLMALYLSEGAVCIVFMAFSYFKVFRIIRHHQCQVLTNGNAINMEKYKKSIFTILYILAVFVFSYIPYICCMIVFLILQDYGESSIAAFNACVVVVFSSSVVNPLLYYWRITEVRDSVRPMVRKLFCNFNGGES